MRKTRRFLVKSRDISQEPFARGNNFVRIDLWRESVACLASEEKSDPFGIGAAGMRQARKDLSRVKSDVFNDGGDSFICRWAERHEQGVR